MKKLIISASILFGFNSNAQESEVKTLYSKELKKCYINDSIFYDIDMYAEIYKEDDKHYVLISQYQNVEITKYENLLVRKIKIHKNSISYKLNKKSNMYNVKEVEINNEGFFIIKHKHKFFKKCYLFLKP